MAVAPAAHANDIIAPQGNSLDGLGLLGLVNVSVTNTAAPAANETSDTAPTDSFDPANSEPSNGTVVDTGNPFFGSGLWNSVALNLKVILAVANTGTSTGASTTQANGTSNADVPPANDASSVPSTTPSTGATKATGGLSTTAELLSQTITVPSGGTLNSGNNVQLTATSALGNAPIVFFPATPEPSEWVLMVTGLALIGLSALRRHRGSRIAGTTKTTDNR